MRFPVRRSLSRLALVCAGLALLPSMPRAASPDLVISQVYGGGGAISGSPAYNVDYIEIFNTSGAAVSLTGKSLQYASATGNFTSVMILSTTSVPAHGYYLVRTSSTGTVGAALPIAPDQTYTTVAMSAASGKVALVNSWSALNCGATATPCTLPNASIVDLVSYGAANNAEGGSPIAGVTLANTQGVVRRNVGCTDSDRNLLDFAVESTPVLTPRNAASPAGTCGGGPTIAAGALPNGFTNVAYPDTQLSASGGTAPYAWRTNNAPPAGLSFSAGGLLTGTPQSAGVTAIAFVVTDAAGRSDAVQRTLTVNDPVAISTASVPTGEVGVAYSVSFAATGGTAPYAWSAPGGLPAGLSLSSAGLLSGTPSAPFAGTLSIQVNDGAGGSANRDYPLSIASALSIPNGSLPDGVVKGAYQQPVPVAGGIGPYAWSLTAGALPAGLSLTPSGTVYGIPTTAGTANFTLQVTDGLGATASRAMTLTVQSFGILTGWLPNGFPGHVYTGVRLTAGGGTAPYTFSVAAGTIPPGLYLMPDGRILGTPTAPGSYPVTWRVTDSTSAVATRDLTLTIATVPAGAEWEPRGLIAQGSGVPFVSANYATDSSLFLAVDGEFYATTDAGRNWSKRSPDPDWAFRGFAGMALSPVYDGASAATGDAGTIFYAISGRGVYKSIDHGATFAPSSTGLNCTQTADCWNGNTGALAISPAFVSDRTLWHSQRFGSDNRVYKSVDAGANWAIAGTLTGVSNAFSVMVVSPNFAVDHTLLATIKYGGKLYRSTDSGATWAVIYNAGVATDIPKIVFSPAYAQDGTIVVSSSNPVISRDFGATFSPIQTGGYAMNDIQGVIRPGNTLRWYLISGYGIYATDDYFASLLQLQPLGVPNNGSGSALAVPPTASGYDTWIFSGAAYLSTDGGNYFKVRNRGFNGTPGGAITTGGTTVFVVNGGGWLQGSNSATVWSGHAGAFTPFLPFQVLLSPDFDNDHRIFAASGRDNSPFPNSYQSMVIRSTDGGNSFTQMFNGGDYTVYSIALPPNYSGTDPLRRIVYRTDYNTVYKSVDDGATFTPLGQPPMPGCRSNASASKGISMLTIAADGTLFTMPSDLNATDAGLCKSVDGGANWIQVKNGAAFVKGYYAVSPVYNDAGPAGPGKTILVGTLRTTDGGATWSAITGPGANFVGKPYLSPGFATDQTAFYAAKQTLYQGYAGVWKSSDGGATFAVLGAGDQLQRRYVDALAFLPGFVSGPGSTSVMIAYAGGALWRSGDGGATFQPAIDHTAYSARLTSLALMPGAQPSLTEATEIAAAVDPAGGMLAGTDDQGIFFSADGGVTFNALSQGLPQGKAVTAVSGAPTAPSNPLAALANGGVWRYNGTQWAPLINDGNTYNSFLDDGNRMYIVCGSGMSLRCNRDGSGCTGMPAGGTDLARIDYNGQSGPTYATPLSRRKGPPAPQLPAVSADPLWAVSTTSGPRHSGDSGTTWTAAPGGNDYALPSQTWTVVRALGVNPATGGRDVLAGSTTGLWLTRDGGDTWRSVSGAGSGLELTSGNFAATLSTSTAYGTTDVLVGVTGTTNGGVYLSGDGGYHWTQINQGFDPANLSISSLVKTSCAGCPVQYYSGTYGSGVYTRTVTVNPPPAFPGVNYACSGSTACTCGSGAFGGPEQGGTPFRLCGSNFQNGAVVEFDGVAATGCVQSGGTVITCTATPAHAPGNAVVRVRNPDTRAGSLPGTYAYAAGAPRAGNSLRVAKAGADASLAWSCPGCTAQAPAWIWRGQNAGLSLYPESYNGGTAATWTNTGAVASAQSYFWTVE